MSWEILLSVMLTAETTMYHFSRKQNRITLNMIYTQINGLLLVWRKFVTLRTKEITLNLQNLCQKCFSIFLFIFFSLLCPTFLL